MSENIVLRKHPRIEFRFLDSGFEFIDGQTEENSGFYSYNDFQAIELNKVWFPTLAKWLRFLTWVLNMGVPYFPNAESYKKANLIIHFKQTKLGLWLTDSTMAAQAKRLKDVLGKKTNQLVG